MSFPPRTPYTPSLAPPHEPQRATAKRTSTATTGGFATSSRFPPRPSTSTAYAASSSSSRRPAPSPAFPPPSQSLFGPPSPRRPSPSPPHPSSAFARSSARPSTASAAAPTYFPPRSSYAPRNAAAARDPWALAPDHSPPTRSAHPHLHAHEPAYDDEYYSSELDDEVPLDHLRWDMEPMVATRPTAGSPPARGPDAARPPAGCLPADADAYVVALYPSDPSIADELPLAKGEMLAVLGDRGEWWKGAATSGAVGYFPKVYTKHIPRSRVEAAGLLNPLAASAPSVAPDIPLSLAPVPADPAADPAAHPSPPPSADAPPDPAPSASEPDAPPAASTPAAGAATGPPPAQSKPLRPARTPATKAPPKKSAKEKMAAFMDSVGVTVFMLVATVYVLFVDDLVTIVGADRSDSHDMMVFIFLVLKVVVFVLFLVELVLTSWADRKYFLSFFFWLDVLALVSLIPDVLLLCGVDILSSISGLTVARTGRVARASARAARLVRVVRVIKITRFIGQNRGASARGWLASSDASASESHALGPAAEAAVNTTTNKLTAVVLVLFLATSLMQTAPAWEPHAEAGLWALETAFEAGAPVATQALARFVSRYPKTLPVLAVRFNGTSVYGDVDKDVWRHYDLFLEPIFTPANTTQAYFLAKTREQTQAAFNIALVVLIILILAVGTILIGLDAKALVHATRKAESDHFHAKELEQMGRSMAARERAQAEAHAQAEAAGTAL